MNDFSRKVIELLNEGFDFVDGKKGYKRETRMWKPANDSAHRYVCVITLWDDDSVSESCRKIPESAIHAGFVQR